MRIAFLFLVVSAGWLCAQEVAPVPEASPAPQAVDRTRVTMLCYHRFESKAKDGLAINPEVFEQQMHAIKDAGVTVVSMEDFLAWRRGEKTLPDKCAIITIDDGYVSSYTHAWPILKKFDYPFTMFVYTDYVRGGRRSGGASMSWEQLSEMNAAGVEIGSHSISHAALTRPKSDTPEARAKWLAQELRESKALIETHLGTTVRTFAYPYGAHDAVVAAAAAEAGYEAAFTVKGAVIRQNEGDPMRIGRFAVDSTKPGTFTAAIAFASPNSAAPAAPEFNCLPPDGNVVYDALPEISIDLSTVEELDPVSLVMTVSGIGTVPAKFDTETKILSYQLRQRLYAPQVFVNVRGKAANKPLNIGWSYGTSVVP